jgi:hypothetical protein
MKITPVVQEVDVHPVLHLEFERDRVSQILTRSLFDFLFLYY